MIFFFTLAFAYLFKGRQWNYRKRGAARLSQRSVGACQEWLRCNGLERLWRHHHERVWLQPGRQNKQKRVDHDSFGPLQAKSRRLKFPVYYFPSENSSTLFEMSLFSSCMLILWRTSMRKIRSNPRYYSYLFSFQNSSNFFLTIYCTKIYYSKKKDARG